MVGGGSWAEKLTTLGKLDTFVALTVPAMCPLACCAASGLACPRKAWGGAAEKGAKRRLTSRRSAWPHPLPPRSSGDGG